MGRFEARTFATNRGTITLRQARPKDASAVHRLFCVTARETEYLLPYPDEIVPESAVLTLLKSKETSPNDVIVIATVPLQTTTAGDRASAVEEPVALGALTGAKFRRLAHGAELALGVVQQFWGLGIGNALVGALSDWAADNGIRRISLEVAADNPRAVELYERNGFVVEGRLRARRKHGETYVDTLQMAKVQL